MDARSARENAQLRAKFYQVLSFLVLARRVDLEITFDDAGVEYEFNESHETDIDPQFSPFFEWTGFLPFSIFDKADPQTVAMYIQQQRNAQAENEGWDLKNTKGVVEET